tara:strand:- start:82 stop:648 length:567 start_codon:yes stop_codon:yes gene_type:complete
MIDICNKCKGELTDDNWVNSWRKIGYKRCRECMNKTNAKNNPINGPINNPVTNPQRMFVNGKYVTRKHPLYKPGNYRSFNDAAFSSFEKYNTTTEGYVYIISNPSYKGWIKVGKAIDAKDRLKSYQTSTPFRDYILEYSKFFNNRNSTEKIAHHNISKIAEETRGEWFRANKYEAMSIIGEIVNETNT